MSLISSPIEVILLTGAPPLEKVNNCWVNSRACKDAFSILASFSVTLLSAAYIFAKVVLFKMAVNILLKSWAIPPARFPRDSSFSVRCISCSIFRFSVTSLNTKTTPMTWLSLSRMGAPLSAMTLSVPSLAISSVLFPSPTTAPSLNTFSTGFSQGDKVFSLIMLKTVLRGFPTASSWLHPVRVSATLLMRTTVLSMSVVMTPSPIDRNVTASRSFSAASESSIFFRSRISCSIFLLI